MAAASEPKQGRVRIKQTGEAEMRLQRWVAVGFAATALMVTAAAQAEPLKIRQGWVVAGADAPLLMFEKQGLAKHEGDTYSLDAVHFGGTPQMLTALGAGELEL